MAATRTPAEEAQELLAGLRRVREDSLRVAEYNTSLSLSFLKQQQTSVDTFEWRAVQQDRLLGKMVNAAQREFVALRDGYFYQWHCVSRGAAALKQVHIDDVAPFKQLQDLLRFRQTRYEEARAGEIQKYSAEWEQFEKQTEEQFAAFTRRMESIIESGKRRRELQAVKMADRTMYTAYFDAWHMSAPRLHTKRQRTLQVMQQCTVRSQMENKQLCMACFGCWRHDAEHKVIQVQNSSASHVIKDMKNAHMDAMFTSEDSKVLMDFLHRWVQYAFAKRRQEELRVFEAEVQKRLENEHVTSSKFPVRCVARSIAFLAIGKVEIGESFDAWKSLAWRKEVEEKSLDLKTKTETVLERSKNMDIAFDSYHARSMAHVEMRIKPLYFATWVSFLYLELRRQNKPAVIENRKRSEAVTAWSGRNKELIRFRKLSKFVQTFDRKRTTQTRKAVQTMYLNLDMQSAKDTFSLHCQVRNKALKDFQAAKARHTTIAREKLNAEDEVSDVYRFKKTRDSLAKRFAKIYVTQQNRDIELWTLHIWRANVAFVRASRIDTKQDAEMKVKQESMRNEFIAKQEKHGGAALSLMRRVSVRYELVWSLHMWKVAQLVISHEFELARARQMYDARHHDAELENGTQLARHMEQQNRQNHATTLFQAFASEDDLLRLHFRAWKNQSLDTHGQTMANMQKLGLLMTAGNRTIRWLVPACLRFWKLYLLFERWDAEYDDVTVMKQADELQSGLLTQRVKHIGPLVEKTIDQYTLFACLQYWRRFHDECMIDKLADSVQIQWSEYEQLSQVKLRSMALGCRNLLQHTHRQIKYFWGWKVAYFALKGWERACNEARVQADIQIRTQSANSALDSQWHFEHIARMEWRETCIFARAEALRIKIFHRFVGAWQWIARSRRSEQIKSRDLPRARAVVQDKETLAVTSRAHLAFSGWHGATCQARCRWIQKQCRRIRAVLGQQADGTPRRRRPSRQISVDGAAQQLHGSASKARGAAHRLSRSTPGQPYVKPPSPVPVLPSRETAPVADTDVFASQLRTFTFGLNQN